MKNTEIIFNSIKKINDVSNDDLEKCDENCLICGKQIKQGVKVKKAISAKFTNFDECKCLNSEYICEACNYCLKDPELRKNNIIADKNKLYLLKKNDLENYLFNLDKYVEGEFIVGITTSFKKHNSFRCRVNSDTKEYFIRQEDKEFIFNADEMNFLYQRLNEAYLQFSKDELLTGQYSMIAIEEFGLEKFEEYENIFKRYRGSNQFELLIYMMNSEKRNEYLKEKMKKKKGANKDV